jgi:hypothetical protein
MTGVYTIHPRTHPMNCPSTRNRIFAQNKALRSQYGASDRVGQVPAGKADWGGQVPWPDARPASCLLGRGQPSLAVTECKFTRDLGGREPGTKGAQNRAQNWVATNSGSRFRVVPVATG